MSMQFSPDGNLLYVKIRLGDVAETAELRDDVYVDLDADGRPVGVEFLNADDFFPFARSLVEVPEGESVDLPDALRVALDRQYGIDIDAADQAPRRHAHPVAASSGPAVPAARRASGR